MRRFYTQQPLTEHSTASLCEKSFHHWVKVLRAKVGDEAVLFNGDGGEYIAQLTEASKKNAQVIIKQHNPVNRNNPYQTTIAIVMSKGERMDYVLQKSTEMGVSRIQLLTSERCELKLKGERLEKKLTNWQGVIISACEQSRLNIVPQLIAPMCVNEYVSNAPKTASKLVLAPTENGLANNPLLNINKTVDNDFHVLIGAEGGLTSEEIQTANDNGFVSWCLGERILRTETAPVVALTHIQAAYLCQNN